MSGTDHRGTNRYSWRPVSLRRVDRPDSMVATDSPSTAPARTPRAAIVVAAGRGLRFGGLKQYGPLAGRRVLDHSVAAARAACDFVVLVVPAERVGDDEPDVDVVVAGGRTRSESVRAGLAVVPTGTRVVLVHDAVRALAEPALFASVAVAVEHGADAAVPAVPVVDTLRLADGGEPPVGRDDLVAVQTPQAFTVEALRRAHATGRAEATDDATLVARGGGTVVIVPGSRENLKITEEADVVVAETFLTLRAPT